MVQPTDKRIIGQGIVLVERAGDPFPYIDGPFSGAAYTSCTDDLLGVLTPGESYQRRFAQADKLGFFSTGVDNVSLEAAVIPLPAGAIFMLTGLGALSVLHRRRRGGAFCGRLRRGGGCGCASRRGRPCGPRRRAWAGPC